MWLGNAAVAEQFFLPFLNDSNSLTTIELCAGAGGQALGLHSAGFQPLALVDDDKNCTMTLKENFKEANVYLQDIRTWNAKAFEGIDLLAAGLPCPPFSKAGKQLGSDDERNLFPIALEIINEVKPKGILIENVPGLLDPRFSDFRLGFKEQLHKMGFRSDFKLINACDFGVSQLRPRVILVALRKNIASDFCWPTPLEIKPPTVGEILYDLMAENGWKKVNEWRQKANKIAPTLVGGSKKHGGPDLGPTRAKKAWESLGVNGHLIAQSAPQVDFAGNPYLTVRMCARLQGFPDSWFFSGKKTASYRQVGNAFPPPVARSVGKELFKVLTTTKTVFIVNSKSR